MYAQGLTVALLLEITSGRAQGPFGISEIKPRLIVYKASAHLAVLCV